MPLYSEFTFNTLFCCLSCFTDSCMSTELVHFLANKLTFVVDDLIVFKSQYCAFIILPKLNSIVHFFNNENKIGMNEKKTHTHKYKAHEFILLVDGSDP